MAGGGFPIPRHELPVISVSAEEHAACRDFMDRMLNRVVTTFETFAGQNQRVVDARRWKHMASRDDMTLYSKRKDATTIGVDQYGAVSRFKHTLPPVDLLMTGVSPGTVENTMNAVITTSQVELALVVTYLHDDVADCAMLHTMETPTEDEPYHFLGYKLFVHKSPMISSIVKHRESTYLESCGLVKLSNGEQVGYRILHSVDLADFRPLTDRNCVRSHQSVSYLYRQESDNMVEVFAFGSLDIGGMAIKPVANAVITEALFGIARLIDCSEAKRLTDMVRERQGVVPLTASKGKPGECLLCWQKRKTFSTSSSITECATCGKPTCSRCRSTKRIFISDGILGRFEKVEVCKPCVLVANNGFSRRGSKPRTDTTSSSTDDSVYSRSTGSIASSSNGSLDDSHLTTVAGSLWERPKFGRSLSSSSSQHEDVFMASRPRSSSASVNSDAILMEYADGDRSQQRRHYQHHDLYYSNHRSNHRRRVPRSTSYPVDTSSNKIISINSMQAQPRITGQQSLTHSGVYKQLVELQQVADSTYHTTKQTAVHMAHGNGHGNGYGYLRAHETEF